MALIISTNFVGGFTGGLNDCCHASLFFLYSSHNFSISISSAISANVFLVPLKGLLKGSMDVLTGGELVFGFVAQPTHFLTVLGSLIIGIFFLINDAYYFYGARLIGTHLLNLSLNAHSNGTDNATVKFLKMARNILLVARVGTPAMPCFSAPSRLE